MAVGDTGKMSAGDTGKAVEPGKKPHASVVVSGVPVSSSLVEARGAKFASP